MKWLLLLLACTCVLASDITPIHKAGYCVERGHKDNGYDGFPLVYNGPAFIPNPPLSDCLEYFPNGSAVCCDRSQTDQLLSNMDGTAKMFFGKCPACLHNLHRMWCYHTCSPDQSLFVDVTETKNLSGVYSVWKEVTKIYAPYAEEFFDSCKDVVTPAGQRVDPMMGTSPRAFLNYQGANPPGMHMTTDFHLVMDADSLQTDSQPCTTDCPCMHCRGACPPPPKPQREEKKCYLHLFGRHWPCLAFGLICGYIGFAGAIIAIWLTLRSKKRTVDVAIEEGEPLLTPRAEKKSISERVQSSIRGVFYRYGHRVYDLRMYFFVGTIIVVAICLVFALNVKVETDPLKLWVPPGSRAALDKKKYDSTFGPFWRIEQLLIHSKDGKPLTTAKAFNELYKMQEKMDTMSVEHNGKAYTLDDLCYKPIPGKTCQIQSPLQYFQMNKTLFNEDGGIQEHLAYCASQSHLDPRCLGSNGAPNIAKATFGGYNGEDGWPSATALIVTYLLLDHNNEADNSPAEKWETEWIKIVEKGFDDPNMLYSFNAQRSVQDELTRESNAAMGTVAISYVVMFAYVSVALSRFPENKKAGLRTWCTLSRFSVGLGGVLVVAMSVVISVGLCTMTGVSATLIIGEVLPFLVLAIGVDNIFILVTTFERLTTQADSKTSVNERLAQTMAKVGPSITLASLSEAAAFLLGTLTRVPAVVTFSVYASLAIFFDFLLQITVFAALLAYDARRMEAGRLECSCAKVEEKDREGMPKAGERLLRVFMRKYFVPFIFKIRIPVVLLTFGMLFFFVDCTFHVKKGLKQDVALPQDSYLIPYFKDLSAELKVGAPMFFVVEGIDFSDPKQQNMICGGSNGCFNNSLANDVARMALAPEVSYIATPANNWLDDYIAWVMSAGCCPGHGLSPCGQEGHPADRPTPEQFWKYLPQFIADDCSDPMRCGVCGMPYRDDIVLNENGRINVTRYMAYHTPMPTQEDFIGGLAFAYNLSGLIEDDIKQNFKKVKEDVPKDLYVFPYSVFYVFFEQYLYVEQVAIMDLLLALAAVFLVTFLSMFNLLASTLIVLVIAMICVDLLGCMYLWNISLNSVSVVNLVMCIGISVEFCAHIVHYFATNPGLNRVERAKEALTNMGSSVFGGITLTKFVGVVVLGFTPALIFKVYYFRMYLLIVLLGAYHGLVFMPVLLSYVGPACKREAVAAQAQIQRKYEKEDTVVI